MLLLFNWYWFGFLYVNRWNRNDFDEGGCVGWVERSILCRKWWMIFLINNEFF